MFKKFFKKIAALFAANKRILLVLICFFIFFCIVFFAFFFGFTYYCKKPLTYNVTDPLVFTINYGESISTISSNLHTQGIIPHPLFFVIYQKVHSKNYIQAGRYNIIGGLSIEDLSNLFQTGIFEDSITFIEGWRLEEFARAYSSWKCGGLGDLPCVNRQYDEFIAASLGLEGRLFPDTYRVSYDDTAEKVVGKLVSNFNAKIKSLELNPDIDLDTTIILASLVEREAKFSQDRPVVAGIILNRWRIGMALEIDATVQYVLADKLCIEKKVNCDWWPSPNEGLSIDSPINTRLYANIPPTPICNPGLASIKAVIEDTPTDYLFYFSDSAGIMHYAISLEDHISNIRQYSD